MLKKGAASEKVSTGNEGGEGGWMIRKDLGDDLTGLIGNDVGADGMISASVGAKEEVVGMARGTLSGVMLGHGGLGGVGGRLSGNLHNPREDCV